jgi:alkaline phosphatase D
MRPLLPLLSLFLLCLQFAGASVSPAPDRDVKNKSTTRIAFGSCNDQREPQPLWPSIVAAQPDLWVWLGDNIYADTRDMAEMAQRYQQQQEHPGYRQLLQTVPITGIWDDHDYAFDNSGKNFDDKALSQQLFLDFMGLAKDAPVREQEGIYRSYTVGEGNQKVKILLLDVRYHRDRLNTLFGLYLPNETGDVLGAEQWQWLEQELSNSDAKVHLIASGMQVLPTGTAYTNWSAFPKARERLFRLIERTQPAIPIIVSGDRHVGELGKINLKGYKYPLYEITSSGMTHHRNPAKGGNIYRIGKQVGALNFGILDIDWQSSYTAITLQIRGEQNQVLLEEEVIYPAI